MTITERPSCRRRLMGDVDGILCSTVEPHTPGILCRFGTGLADHSDHHASEVS